MTAPDNLETRVTALETQVRGLTQQVRHNAQDAAAARVLAGGADRDVTEIRAEIRDFRQATTASFNAMRDDFTDFRKEMTDLRKEMNYRFVEVNSKFAEVSSRFAEVSSRFADVDKGFVEMRGKFDATAAGQQQIVTLLTTLIGQQDGHAAGR